jgi:hypothetical protein
MTPARSGEQRPNGYGFDDGEDTFGTGVGGGGGGTNAVAVAVTAAGTYVVGVGEPRVPSNAGFGLGRNG